MAETTSSRLQKIFDDAIKELERQRKVTRQEGLREGSVEAQRRPLLDEIDRSERYLLDYEESLKAAEKRGEDSRKKVRSLTNTLKQAEAWYRDAQFTARGADAQDALLRDWNDAARSIFGVGLVDEPTLAETLISGRRLDVPLQEIFEGFREEIASLENQISEQEAIGTDASSEVAAVQKDIRDTQRDIESINYDLDRVVEKGTVNEGVEQRLGTTPDLEGLSVKEKDEAIISWLMDGEEYDLSFKNDLQELVDSDDITAGLPRVRKLIADNEERLTRERVASGDRRPEVDATGGQLEAGERDRFRGAPAEPVSPEEEFLAVQAQDRRDRATERSDRFANTTDPGQRAGRRGGTDPLIRTDDPNRSGQFGGGSTDVFAEDTEPFANTMDPGQRRRSGLGKPISQRIVGAIGGPLEAGERDRFRGTTEEDDEDTSVSGSRDDGTTPSGTTRGDGTTPSGTATTTEADAPGISGTAATFIRENFGLTTFFLDRDDMRITDPETGELVNVLEYAESKGISNDEEIFGLISQTEWFQNTGPTARAFEKEWSMAGEAGREELLDETSDLISREAKKIGLTLSEEDLYALSFNAKMMGMDQYEIRQEFVDNWELSFDSEAVQAGNIAALRNKVNQTAGKYMLLLDDSALADAAESLYLGEATIEGLEAGFRNQAIEQMPELGGLIKQGYTPQMYFSSYKSQAERLLERKIDFMGDDRNMFINLMGGQQDDTYIQKPLTLTQANRYFRGLDEWKYTRNANQEARGMADQIGRMFGAVA
tara:strand:+ start:5488 stop:7800 length:2313 start_codon:yes stop_codon:yes gene_type:complete